MLRPAEQRSRTPGPLLPPVGEGIGKHWSDPWAFFSKRHTRERADFRDAQEL